MTDIERHVLEYIGENSDSPDVFTEGSTELLSLRDSINDAIDEVNMVVGDWKRKYSIPLRKDAGFYRINNGETGHQFGWIASAWLRGTNRRLEQTEFNRLAKEDPGFLDTNGNPWQYAPIGMASVFIYPAPSSSGGVVELDCVIIPARYASEDDRVYLRDSWKWAVVHYAVADFWASRGDAESAVAHHDKYLTQMNLLSLVPRYGDKSWGFKTQKQGQPNDVGRA